MKTFKKNFIPLPKQGIGIPLNKFTAPFDLEIGCGTGEFAIQWAKRTKNPVIAIEKTRSRFFKFKKKYREMGEPKNLWPINTNAVWWLAHYGKKNMFEHIFLLYPNPYPKKQQAHLRWVNRPFMPFLLNLLKKGGELQLRTNKSYYYEEFKKRMQFFSFMCLGKDIKILNSSKAQSLFEAKYLEKEENCHILEYRKL